MPGDDDELEAEEQLALAGGDERLPWLESDDDYEQPGVDTGRIMAFAAVGLLAVVLVVGALWWFTRDSRDVELVADGSTIEAPDEPYRTRPDDPGGRQVEGTGQTSFEVAEGEQVEGRIAAGSIPAPSIDREQAQAGGAATAPAPSGGIGVQVGAYSTREAAEAGWSQLAGRFEPLQGRSHRVVEGTVDGGRIYRLQAVAGTAAEADTLCGAIKSAGGDCQVKR
ncbi:MAG TPA: SPOR domain-containing protein [Croceibacterium sp.]|nr:SPOR domain-containing protein [Croceibacterium sp.]